ADRVSMDGAIRPIVFSLMEKSQAAALGVPTPKHDSGGFSWTAVFDESGLSLHDDYFAIGALVALGEDWVPFEQQWLATLTKHQAAYLHMREFAHRIEAFKGWTEQQRRALLADCLDALCGMTVFAFGTAMSSKDFRFLDPKGKESPIGRLFRCFQETLTS